VAFRHQKLEAPMLPGVQAVLVNGWREGNGQSCRQADFPMG